MTSLPSVQAMSDVVFQEIQPVTNSNPVFTPTTSNILIDTVNVVNVKSSPPSNKKDQQDTSFYTKTEKIVTCQYLVRETLKKNLFGTNIWSKQYFRLRRESDKLSFLDYYPNDKPSKPVGSIALAGAFVRMLPQFESLKTYKRKNIVEIQDPNRKWKLDFGESYKDKLDWHNILTRHSCTFPGKLISVDGSLARNSPKDHIFTNIFDAGDYYEELPIVKSICLIGEGKVIIYPPKTKRILTDSQVTLFSPDNDLPGAAVYFENLTFDLTNEKKLSVVHVFSGNVTFKNCNFVGGDVCIKGSRTSCVSLEKCNVSLAKRYGVCFMESTTLSIKDSIIKNNGYDGIYTTDNSLFFAEKCVIEHNSYNGISLNSTHRSVLLSNIITQNKWDGISVGITSSVIILKENEFLENAGLGCYFSKGKGNKLVVEYEESLDYEFPENIKGYSNDVIQDKNVFKGNSKGSIK